jgi:site-specific DNA-cytosine methylase
MKIRNVLSLFDGMSCGQIALTRVGIGYDRYYASEIDSHAIRVTEYNYPNTVQLGDVTKWRDWDIDWSSVDLVFAGSPCQGFSFAGKQLAFDDPRSALFFTFVEIWQHVKKHNPDAHYLLENVKMAKEHELVISRYMGVHPIEINSALVSAQNRVRLYWTNIANEPFGLFGDMQCMIPQPKDKGVLLRDILEKEFDEKYYLSETAIHRILGYNNADGMVDNSGKSNCLTTVYHKLGRDNTYIVAQRGRNPENPKSRKVGLPTEQMLEPRFDGKTNCLTSVQKDNYVIYADGYEQDKRAYFESGKSGCLDMKPARQKVLLEREWRIRRLTPMECERLQTVGDNYTSCVSDTQRYRMLGNGWTVDVICHILSYM